MALPERDGQPAVGETGASVVIGKAADWPEAAALPAMPFVPYAGAVPDGGRHGHGGEIRRAPIV